MSDLSIQFRRGGVFFPTLGLWLDPHEPQRGPEKVFISHAHADHLGAHREVILTAPTARLMQARIGGERREHILELGVHREFSGSPNAYRLTLLPAGHILGSAMAFIEANGQSLLYTGDFKLRRSLSAEPCQPCRADVLIMETTYGRPQYRFPPADKVIGSIIRFCREALDNDETVLLLGYSLGKSQELLCGLTGAGLPIMLHDAVHALTRIYEDFGRHFPAYERYDAGAARGKVLLCPPSAAVSAMIKNLGPVRTAVLTGWALDPQSRFRFHAEAAFPLSDHSDFLDSIELVRRVDPKKVYTLHGFAADFAQSLRQLGFDAQALSQQDQAALPLLFEKQPSSSVVPKHASDRGGRLEARPLSGQPADSFMRFAEACAAIAPTTSKLEKARLLADYLKTLDAGSLSSATVWFTRAPFSPTQTRVWQVGAAVLRDAICAVGGISAGEYHQVFLRHSEIGETAFEICQGQPTMALALSIGEVNLFVQQVHEARASGVKVSLLFQVFRRCSPLEAKFLVKLLTSGLRIGLRDGLVEEAVALAFGVRAEEVEKANLLLGHLGETARLAFEHRLGDATLIPFRPVKFMLASPEEFTPGIGQRIRAAQASPAQRPSGEGGGLTVEAGGPAPDDGSQPFRPVWIEDVYDGMRCQLHKTGSRVELYARDLKDMTDNFQELAESARGLAGDVILDGELVAMRGEAMLPFSELQRRLGRREADLFFQDEVPVALILFDLLWLNGESLLELPLLERRAALERLALPEGFWLALVTRANSCGEIEAALTAAKHRGNAGLMIKNPESLYYPGRQDRSWLKLT